MPHVDNVGASGSWILGVSLGGVRTLRLQQLDAPGEPVDVVLPSGSLYIQRWILNHLHVDPSSLTCRDILRYKWKHSILPAPVSTTPLLGQMAMNHMTSCGGIQQRLSVMMRVSGMFGVPENPCSSQYSGPSVIRGRITFLRLLSDVLDVKCYLTSKLWSCECVRISSTPKTGSLLLK
jgi:hypothetical protein